MCDAATLANGPPRHVSGHVVSRPSNYRYHRNSTASQFYPDDGINASLVTIGSPLPLIHGTLQTGFSYSGCQNSLYIVTSHSSHHLYDWSYRVFWAYYPYADTFPPVIVAPPFWHTNMIIDYLALSPHIFLSLLSTSTMGGRSIGCIAQHNLMISHRLSLICAGLEFPNMPSCP